MPPLTKSLESFIKSKFLVGAACVLCAPATYAQDNAGGGANEPEAYAIFVVGTKLSRLKAIEEKRDDSRIIDALGIDELGQLPDKNVGESLNRLPGVTMLVEKGEGRFVQIRGINPSSEEGRVGKECVSTWRSRW